MVVGILGQNEDFQVIAVESGDDALAQISESEPNLVVSDLQMPEMNGLELVSQIQLRYPNLPVVLTTAHGSEDLAVEALRSGAASYVPKTQLSECLLETVDDVLATVGEDEVHQRLAECVDSAAFGFTLSCDFSLIGNLIGMLQNVAGNSVRFQPGKLHRFTFGLSAAMGYVMCRGILGWSLDEFELLHTGDEATAARAVEQSNQAPYSERQLRVNANFTRDEVTIVISHDGEALTDEIAHFNSEDALSGTGARGLVLMCAFFSSVEVSEDGRTLTLGAST